MTMVQNYPSKSPRAAEQCDVNLHSKLTAIGPKRGGGHQTCLSINRLWHELCDMLRRLVGTTAPGHHDCSIQE
ncbi:hypothetical protein TNCV_345181 [Trichonephila clavipes]|nr:hypothetical protein TNCV_345181 [Trichonephila clavipes]